MSIGLGLSFSFKSKAEAVKYAIETTSVFKEGQTIPQYDKAQELYEFIIKNVTLPDVTKEPLEEFTPIINALSKKLE